MTQLISCYLLVARVAVFGFSMPIELILLFQFHYGLIVGCSQNCFGLGVRVVRVTGNPALVTGVSSLQVVIPLVLEISQTFMLGFFPFSHSKLTC